MIAPDDRTIEGSCLCNSVRFSIGGRFGEMNHCHCSMCRKYHGAAFATYLHVQKLIWLNGEELISEVQSSPGAYRTYCSICGSVLPTVSISGHGFDVPAGSLDQDCGVRPTKHIFVESRASWFDPGNDLPRQIGYGSEASLPNIHRTGREKLAGAGHCGGSCACADVTFRYQIRATDRLLYCHCSRCRKVNGAAHATNVFVTTKQFEWITGEQLIACYDHAGSERFGNYFCRQCGSSLPRRVQGSALFTIPAGTLDDDPLISPEAHIFVDSKAPWYEIPDKLRLYARYRES